jgi:hypothetical protein
MKTIDEEAATVLLTDRLLRSFRLAAHAVDLLDTPELREQFLRMLHGYTLTDWIRLERVVLKVDGDTDEGR